MVNVAGVAGIPDEDITVDAALLQISAAKQVALAPGHGLTLKNADGDDRKVDVFLQHVSVERAVVVAATVNQVPGRHPGLLLSVGVSGVETGNIAH